ncbi:hypothetical protein DU508_22840 [Pedobacter chinensis]|uniref:Uncharacterized protein n=1 Tax=Pedobacter chinensis TaxID=2282421 RepID=A0A369PNQ5_9SPHI|nr:hypothetical protein DU508_22840 [Pedobacter chinensis]
MILGSLILLQGWLINFFQLTRNTDILGKIYTCSNQDLKFFLRYLTASIKTAIAPIIKVYSSKLFIV